MRDAERGVVWEEVMILLPPQVRFVFLSATIPNAFEFAEWIAQLHSQPCHVVYTARPRASNPRPQASDPRPRASSPRPLPLRSVCCRCGERPS